MKIKKGESEVSSKKNNGKNFKGQNKERNGEQAPNPILRKNPIPPISNHLIVLKVWIY